MENAIRDAVLTGKIVTTHEQQISFAGGTNVGYIITDPETGAGAYIIESGASGSFIRLEVLLLLVGMFLIAAPVFFPGIGVFLALVGILISGCALAGIYDNVYIFLIAASIFGLAMSALRRLAASGGNILRFIRNAVGFTITYTLASDYCVDL